MSASVGEFLQQIRQLLNKDADFGQQCSTSEDLCRLLADGEDLCCLLSVLSNGRISPEGDGTVSFYSMNSEMFGRRNVKFFLSKCVHEFQMKREDLFEAEDLLLLRRPDRVLTGLRRLLSLQGLPNPANERMPSVASLDYQPLSCASRRQSDFIYSEPETPAAAASTPAAQLENIVSEICHLQAQLVDRLSLLLKFHGELRGPLSEWSSDLLDSTFKHTEHLLQVHEYFKQQLDSLAESKSAANFCTNLGSMFLQVKPRLSAVYSKYYPDYPLAKAKMEEAFQQQPQLRRQLELLERHFNAESFSILYDSPSKQMFNYQILFERLHRTAEKELATISEQAANSVELAVVECRRLLSHLNERKRYSEQEAATRQILQSIEGLPEHLTKLENVGLHRGDGQFRATLGKEQRALVQKECFCLLTDRQLIVATPAASSNGSSQQPWAFLFDVSLYENDLQLECRAGEPGGLQLKQSGKGLVRFSRPGAKKLSAGVGASLWTQLLEVRAANLPDGWNSGGHRFRRVTFEEGSECSRCRETFAGLYFQGYHCDHCNQQLDRTCLTAFLRHRPVSYPLGGPADSVASRCQQLVHDHLDRWSAERLLRRSQPGAFLIRQSGEKLVLSIRWQRAEAYHVIIQQRVSGSTGSQQYSVDPKNGIWHQSLERLVTHHRTNTLTIENVTGICLLELLLPSIYENFN
ncbi:hypothetical protein BOX15_Mlig006464g2 [Macrostomum lignano]|uniref:Rho guanine nucleotide exchange factor 33 n=2 Tax=Macrostomum lignano TaxID=282301 RepID=A0A1I8HEF8_9PLAT|nr:hypothetical protein BOX15_Mlig006464g2 [Macrostomum lignano]